MNTKFADWLLEKMDERDLTPASLARKTSLHPGSINNVLNGSRRAGPDVCRGVATALGISEVEVFRAAGLLSPVTQNEVVDRVIDLAEQLSEEERLNVLEYVTWRVQKQNVTKRGK